MRQIIFCSVVIFILSLNNVHCRSMSVGSDDDSDSSTSKQDVVDSLINYEVEIMRDLEKSRYYALRKNRDTTRENYSAPNYAKFIECTTLIEDDINRAYNSTRDDIQKVLKDFNTTEYVQDVNETFENKKNKYLLIENSLRLSIKNHQEKFKLFLNESGNLINNCVTQIQLKKTEESTTKISISSTEKSLINVKKDELVVNSMNDIISQNLFEILLRQSENNTIKFLDAYKNRIIFELKKKVNIVTTKIHNESEIQTKNIACYPFIYSKLNQQMTSDQDDIFKIIDSYKTEDFFMAKQHLTKNKNIKNILDNNILLMDKIVGILNDCVKSNLPTDLFIKIAQLHDGTFKPIVEETNDNKIDDKNQAKNINNIFNDQITNQRKIINEFFNLINQSSITVINKINNYEKIIESTFSKTLANFSNEIIEYHDESSNDLKINISCLESYKKKLEDNYSVKLVSIDSFRQSIIKKITDVNVNKDGLIKSLIENQYDDGSFNAKLMTSVKEYLEEAHSVQMEMMKIIDEFSKECNYIIMVNQVLCKISKVKLSLTANDY